MAGVESTENTLAYYMEVLSNALNSFKLCGIYYIRKDLFPK